MRYQEALRRDFDAIATTDGTIYHQRGGYEIAVDGGDVLIPVNRSYRQIVSQYGKLDLSRDNYTNHDRVINDSADVDTELQFDERLVYIYGKPILFLNTGCENIQREFSTNPDENMHVSIESALLVKRLALCLQDLDKVADIGVYGSHQMGLNKYDSDLDLVAWAHKNNRKNAVVAIDEAFRDLGYVPVNLLQDVMGKYAKRYAKRTGLSVEVGHLLARQRMRWISPGGVSTSLQCLHADYDHDWATHVVNAGLGDEYEIQPEELYNRVEIIQQSEAYNFPRLWRVAVDGEEASAISFDWAHQDMGSDTLEMYSMRARKILTKLGETVYVLSSESDFIVPSRVMG